MFQLRSMTEFSSPSLAVDVLKKLRPPAVNLTFILICIVFSLLCRDNRATRILGAFLLFFLNVAQTLPFLPNRWVDVFLTNIFLKGLLLVCLEWSRIFPRIDMSRRVSSMGRQRQGDMSSPRLLSRRCVPSTAPISIASHMFLSFASSVTAPSRALSSSSTRRITMLLSHSFRSKLYMNS